MNLTALWWAIAIASAIFFAWGVMHEDVRILDKGVSLGAAALVVGLYLLLLKIA